MSKLHSNQTVICVFERSVDDDEVCDLLQIFQDPKDALKYIEDNSENEMMFWEQWQVTERRNDKQ